MSDLEQELSRLKNLCDEATSAPWFSRTKPGPSEYGEPERGIYSKNDAFICGFGEYVEEQPESSDERFIRSARTVMPRLIDALEIARRDLQSIANGCGVKDGKARNLAKAALKDVEQILRGER